MKTSTENANQASTLREESVVTLDFAAILSTLESILQRQDFACESYQSIAQDQQAILKRLDQIEQWLRQADRVDQAPVPVELPSKSAVKPDPTVRSVVSTDSWEKQKAQLLMLCDSPDDLLSSPTAAGASASPPALKPSSTETPAVRSETSFEEFAARELRNAELESNDERIVEMRRQWEQKLRQAEIEISIERAKVARMKSDLDVKLVELNQKLRKLNEAEKSDRNSDRAGSRFARFLPHRGRRDSGDTNK